ncbi:MAG TPA: hypothetical protein VLE97_05160 [Gaiellaceae bacterium]|nr:hypothetical protein [Gaiellaceae bacterium]
MRLDTHLGTYADPADTDDVARAVAGLTAEGKAFVILTDGGTDAETYVQAAGTAAEEFIVEYRDGRPGEHYRGDRRVTADELVALFVAYLRRAPDWKDAITWHRVRVDFGALNDNAPSA